MGILFTKDAPTYFNFATCANGGMTIKAENFNTALQKNGTAIDRSNGSPYSS
jgi:hypothetical protein